MALARTTTAGGGIAGKGVTTTPTARAGYGNYNTAQAIAKSNPIIKKPTATLRQEYVNSQPKTVYVNTSSDTGGGGGDYSYSGGSSDDIINKIKELLNQQKEQADAYYKTLYEQQTAQNKQSWENNRNQINRNFARGSRYLQNMYGDSVSGQGLSNRARNYQNWQSNLAENQRNYTNNDATALSQYNMNKANTASQLAQGWYNYVLPVYTNRQQNLDDYDYRKYLASL